MRKHLDTLTPIEWGIISHRLAVPDALADALTDYENPPYTWDEVYAKAGELLRQLELTRTLNLKSRPKIEQDILVDCLDGSTIFGSAEDAVETGEITRAKLRGQQRAADSLVEKFKAAGFKSNVPRC